MRCHVRAASIASGAALFAVLLTASPASAQTPAEPPPVPQPAAAPSPSPQPDSQNLSDARVDALQPDFTLAALPVTLRLPEHKLAFRVTHRFTRSLGQGDFGDLLSNFFGFDSGAQIGLELRYGLLPGTQVGIHRTSDRTIELFGQHSFWREGPHPLAIDAIATYEGTDNLRGQHSGAFGALVSRKLAGRAAVYVEPIFVVNTNALPSDVVADNNTFMLGLGTRVRIRPTTYIVAEVTPRLAGYDPGVNQASFALEKRVGGHTFQINFSNGFGTTLGQIARGGVSNDSWFIGFNISRKFF
ncbi:MAG TPA: DUF5777 family beta-barrel protein [Vicinamibacterales bacterium]|jgi:hypothetical protein|nr:DUF5777 family beta-barrel protein [Vicinamibacterales bacterium]